ncbi:hypothetical protein PSTG_09296 [Puccinia striiformis f. sp. tritici PST-78]|uniref:NEDD8-activating enzyme E1 regulatory subunit n=1 Tax=Puccinia striiformis f. sp. tritici PST-78 TaxID=1165861 RepID=A0A0L0VDU5_9BASI|nr:hypothetical protein PSTG_09296 [Puccinia striiformis f. sp. tritici PST-78]
MDESTASSLCPMKREAEHNDTLAQLQDQMRQLTERLAAKNAKKDDAESEQEAAFISPNSERPDREAQIFDRQLRLWEAEGQKRLTKACAKVCDCSATSAQIVKNLILSGLGHVEMYDDKVVRQSDIGNHFFLNQKSLGQNRTKACAELLNELSSTRRPVMCEDELLDDNYYEQFELDFTGFDSWNAYICVRLPSDAESTTAHHCWDFNVPCIFVQTCGLVATIRTQIREQSVIPNHSDGPADLRLDCPFPSLLEFVNSFEMDKLDNHEHAHVPAVVIVIHFMEIFKSKHDGNLPQDSDQREELKAMILAEKRNADEDNFDEAVGMIWRACQPTQVPAHVEELFNNPHCDKIPWYDGRFWLLVRSLRKFVKENPSHQLPLSGVLPDMKSDTKNYIKLQSIYRQQASEDLKTFKEIKKDIGQSLREHSREEEEDRTESGHCTEGPDFDVSPEMLQSFVKNSAHIRLIRGSECHQDPTDLMSRFEKECEPGNQDYIATWYLAFEALSYYRARNGGEYPGMRKGKEDDDFNKLSKSVAIMISRPPGSEDKDKEIPEKMQKVLREMVRSGGSELPHISSLAGGIVAQEVIKLITGQYIPMNGVCIFDGYRSTMGVLELDSTNVSATATAPNIHVLQRSYSADSDASVSDCSDPDSS